MLQHTLYPEVVRRTKAEEVEEVETIDAVMVVGYHIDKWGDGFNEDFIYGMNINYDSVVITVDDMEYSIPEFDKQFMIIVNHHHRGVKNYTAWQYANLRSVDFPAEE